MNKGVKDLSKEQKRLVEFFLNKRASLYGQPERIKAVIDRCSKSNHCHLIVHVANEYHEAIFFAIAFVSYLPDNRIKAVYQQMVRFAKKDDVPELRKEAASKKQYRWALTICRTVPQSIRQIIALQRKGLLSQKYFPSLD